MKQTKKKWRYSTSTGMHYYEDDKYGYGTVQAAVSGGYLAVAPGNGLVEVVKRVKDGKALVEKACCRRRCKCRR